MLRKLVKKCLLWLGQQLRMPCAGIVCEHRDIFRFRTTCLWCRERRLYYGKLDKQRYHTNRFICKGHIVIPNKQKTYTLFENVVLPEVTFIRTRTSLVPRLRYNSVPMPRYQIVADEYRRFLKLKTFLLEKTFALAEWLWNRKTKLLERQRTLLIHWLCTLSEGLAN